MQPKLAYASARNLEKPVFEEYEDYMKVVFTEKPDYKVISAGVQFCATGEKHSGDTWSVFTDDKGWLYSVICDGMGTGTKAAISSGLAVKLLEKLLKAGFSIDSAISTINTSLISKSGEECSVTLDLVAFDLYSGRTESYKCGAQSSIIKKRGKVSDISAQTLPLGILNQVDVENSVVDLGVGDIVLMCSDGVRDEDIWQIRNAVKTFDSGDVNKFVKELSETVRRSQPQRKDDFTMVVLAISGNR
jgi:stage II sporulation protein E